MNIIVDHVDRLFVFKYSCPDEMWDGIISFPLLDGPVYPMVREIRKEAFKPLSSALRELE